MTAARHCPVRFGGLSRRTPASSARSRSAFTPARIPRISGSHARSGVEAGCSARRSSICPESEVQASRGRMQRPRRSARHSSGTPRRTSRTNGSWSPRPGSSETRRWRPSGLRSSRPGNMPRAGSPSGRSRREHRVPWVAGYSLPEGRPAWLPAELVFLGDSVPAGKERIGYATSSGMACAEQADDAFVRGLCEVLERDAFMVVWANRLSLPRLDWTARRADPRARPEAVCPARAGLRGDRPLAVPPAADGARDRPRPGRLPRRARCRRRNGADHGARVVEGALGGVRGARRSAKLALLDDSAPTADRAVASFEDHIRFYADHGRAARTAFLDAEPATASRSAPIDPSRADLAGRPGCGAMRSRRGGGLERLCRRCHLSGCSLPRSHGREGARSGAVLARRCPRRALPWHGGRRLYHAACDAGLRPQPLAELGREPDPHPFP